MPTSSFTRSSAEDPAGHTSKQVEELAKALILAWEARPDEHEGEISREAYVELVLRIAQIDDERPNWKDNRWPRVSEVYDKLSTSEVQQVGMSNIDDSHLLKIQPSQSKKTANGWTATRTSYELHPAHRSKIIAALELGDPAELAEAVDEAVTADYRKRIDSGKLAPREDMGTTGSGAARQESLNQLVGFFSPGAKVAGDPGAGEAGNGKEEGEPEGREAGWPPRKRTHEGSDVPSNGCEVNSSEEGQNRRYERSDRENRDGSEQCLERHSPSREKWETRGTRAQREYLDSRVRSAAERLLFLHLLGHARSAMYSSGQGGDGFMQWVGVPAEKMEREMGAPYHSTYRVWHESELIEPFQGGYYVPPTDDGAQPQARAFRIREEAFEEFTSLGDGTRRWWLHTEKPARTDEPGPMSSDLKDENDNYHPDLIDEALRVLDGAEHRIDLEPIRDAIKSLAGQNGREARARKANLQLALETIERQADGSEGVVSLQNAYTPDECGGRVSFKDGGPQGMLKAVKARAYDLKGYTNYDISSCHTAALKQLADDLKQLGVDIDTSPLDEYPGKYEAADNHNLPSSLVKTTEHAVKNGGYLPASLAQARVIEQEIPGELKIVEEARGADVDTDRAIQELHDIFADYRQVAVEIAEALLTTYWDEHKQPGGPKGWCMKNHCGVSFYRDEWTEDEDEHSWCHRARTRVMAWALRGLEAAFCHSLTILSEEYDYEVAANEHDGLIVDGELPDEDESDVIDQAREMSGFHRAELVEKAFADKEDVEALYGEDEESEEQDGRHQEDQEPSGKDDAAPEKTEKEDGAKRYPGRASSPPSKPTTTATRAPQSRSEEPVTRGEAPPG